MCITTPSFSNMRMEVVIKPTDSHAMRWKQIQRCGFGHCLVLDNVLFWTLSCVKWRSWAALWESCHGLRQEPVLRVHCAEPLAASNIFFLPSMPDMASTFFLQSLSSTGLFCGKEKWHISFLTVCHIITTSYAIQGWSLRYMRTHTHWTASTIVHKGFPCVYNGIIVLDLVPPLVHKARATQRFTTLLPDYSFVTRIHTLFIQNRRPHLHAGLLFCTAQYTHLLRVLFLDRLEVGSEVHRNFVLRAQQRAQDGVSRHANAPEGGSLEFPPQVQHFDAQVLNLEQGERNFMSEMGTNIW